LIRAFIIQRSSFHQGEPPMVLRVIMVAGIVLVIGLLVVDIRGWLAGTRLVTQTQKCLRISYAFLMALILAALAVGDGWVARYGPLVQIIYLIVLLMLAVILVALVMLDIRQVGLRWGEQRRQNLIDLVNSIETEDRPKNPPGSENQ
jgi:hypothetical protein